EFSGYTYSMKTFDRSTSSMWGPDGELIYSYGVNGTDSPTRNSYLDFDGGINYQRSTRRKGETITLSYLVSSTGQSQESVSMYEDAVNLPVPYTGASNDFTLRFLEQTGQFDWTRPINEANKFDVGVKYIHRKNHSVNDQEYFGVSKSHSDFRHITQVFAAYFDYRLKWRKFGARAGLRYEFSRLSAKFEDGSAEPFASNLNDWVPNAALSYDINDANTLKLSYSTRINRPGISQLNPAVISTPTSVSSGNPDLVSAHHQSVNINYNLVGRKLSLDLSTSYSFINNSIIPVQELIEGDILRSGYANEGKNRWFNIAAWANYSIGDKTSLMLNANINYGYSANPSLDIHASGWGGYGYLRVRQKLPWKLTLTPYANLYQSTPGLYSSAKFSLGNNLRYGIDLQRSFLKENRLTVSLSIHRPFGKSPTITESTPHNNGQSGYNRSYDYNNANIVGIRIGYRFGSLNVQVKKTAASISNDDVDSRRN
ncbi:MAG: outer membrane beta-barrel family protein, partial [Muribaculaceae bacterium]|nr:outer membrane beta-barrel family protein [Muribaculaceae bacterium]